MKRRRAIKQTIHGARLVSGSALDGSYDVLDPTAGPRRTSWGEIS
jgi:hypothetical protein